MDTGYITALAALGGTAVGGLTSFVTSWTTLSAQMRAQRRASSKSRRQKLYKTFIIDAAKVYGDALICDNLDLAEDIHLYAHISRMRVLSSESVVDEAIKVVRSIVEAYSRPNISLQPVELTSLEGVDLLRNFSEACRTEFEKSLEV